MSGNERLQETRKWIEDVLLDESLEEVARTQPLFIVTPSNGTSLHGSRRTRGIRKEELKKYYRRLDRMKRTLSEIVGPVRDDPFEDPLSEEDLSRIEVTVRQMVPEGVCTRNVEECIAALDEGFRLGATGCDPMITQRRVWWFACSNLPGHD